MDRINSSKEKSHLLCEAGDLESETGGFQDKCKLHTIMSGKTRFQQFYLLCRDPDGIGITLILQDAAAALPVDPGDIPEVHKV